VAIKALFFDFDGTIADSSPGIIASTRYALDKNNVGNGVTDNDIRNAIGPPLIPLIERILGKKADEDLVKKTALSFREHYTEKGLFMTDLYEGVEKVLKFLSVKYTLFIVSSKPEEFLEKLMSALSVRKYFRCIYSPGLGLTPLKKAELVKACMTENNLKACECIMIGDKAEDVTAAKASGIKTVGVLYGFGTAAELKEVGAACLIEKSDDLIKLNYDSI
jgi:phosphoglycolate phosphatase